MIVNNITEEVIIGQIPINERVINSMHPVDNITIDKMKDKDLIIEGVTEVDHREEACSPIEGRLEMIKEATELEGELKKQSHIWDIRKMNHETAGAGRVPTMNHVHLDSAGQRQ